MACSCNKKTIVYKNEKIEIFDRNTAPFDSCVNCARKHLAFALSLFNSQEKPRGCIEVYLCFKHLEKRFFDLAKTIFNLYVDLITEKANENDIKLILKFFMREFNNIKQSEEEKTINLQNTLADWLRLKTYLWAAYELMFHEYGYQELNREYAIGFLQLAVELEKDDLKKQMIRALWVNENVKQEQFEKLLKEY